MSTNRLRMDLTELAEEVIPVDLRDRALRTSRRLGIQRAVATSAAALVLLGAATGTAFAFVNRNNGTGPAPATTATVTPSPTATATSESTPSPTTSPSGGKAPDGRISKADLGQATLDIPAWAPDALVDGCVSGPVKFTDGHHSIRDSVAVWIEKVVYADVDHDGAQETVARLSCGDQVSTFQVVAFDRDAGGAIRTLGQVALQTGPVQTICDIRADAGGTVGVKVGDFPTPLRCLEPPTAVVAFQWRSYGWNGTRFVQTGGPTSFPVNPRVTDLSVTSTDLVFAAPAGGVRHGSMTVTVRNLGPVAVPYQVVIQIPGGLQLTAPSGCKIEPFAHPGANVICGETPPFAPGATKTVTFLFDAMNPVTPDFLPRAMANLADGYGDSKPENNEAYFAVKF